MRVLHCAKPFWLLPCEGIAGAFNDHVLMNPFPRPEPTDLERRLREAELLIRINAAAADLSPISVLSTVCEEVALAIGVSAAGFAQLNRAEGTLTVIAEARPRGRSAIGLRIDNNPLTREVTSEARGVIVSDVSTDTRLGKTQAELLERGVKSMMVVPVIARGEVIGTLGLDALEPHRFTQQDMDLAASVVRSAVPILEQTRIFEQLKDSLERFERLVHGIDGVVWESVWVADEENFLCDYASPQASAMFGYPHSAFIGLDRDTVWHAIPHPDDLEYTKTAMLQVCQSLQSFDMEYRAITATGEQIWISDQVSAWRHGDTVRLRGLMQDITKRKQSERLEGERNAVLELIARGAALDTVMGRLRQMAEQLAQGTTNALIVFDESGFSFANAVGLPRQLVDKLLGESGQSFLLQFTNEKKLLRAGLIPQVLMSDSRINSSIRAAFANHIDRITALPVRSSGGELLATMLVFHDAPEVQMTQALLAVMDLLAIAIERSKLLSTLKFQATHDQLTHLPNRSLYEQRLSAALAQGDVFGLLSVDLNGFKEINDCYGHSVGDELLLGIAACMKPHLRIGNTLARLGGDEFVMILRDITERDGCLRVAASLRAAIKDFRLPNGAGVSASIGTAIFPSDAGSATDLYRVADAAMYKEKRASERRRGSSHL